MSETNTTNGVSAKKELNKCEKRSLFCDPMGCPNETFETCDKMIKNENGFNTIARKYATRKICQYCVVRGMTCCKSCTWPEYSRYPTLYQGRKFRSLKGMDEEIK